MVGTRASKSGTSGRKKYGNSNPSHKRRQRKRGHPDSDAKIIRLTPEEILEDRMYICEVCSSIFRREQNLVVHASMHHIKLKMTRNIDKGLSPIRCKNAYICPVTTCRHHDKRYALTEISSIKKHYGRKHCEKTFACGHCTKKYALKGDLKAHLKRHFKGKGAAESSKRAAAFSNDWSESEGEWSESESESEKRGHCTKKYALKGDLKAKRHFKGKGAAESSRRAAVFSNDWSESEWEWSESESESEENDPSVDVASDSDDDENSDDEDDISVSLGTDKQPEDYVPLFGVAPDKGEQEEAEQTTADVSASSNFDLDMLESLPMGSTGLPAAGCNSINDSKEPIATENFAALSNDGSESEEAGLSVDVVANDSDNENNDDEDLIIPPGNSKQPADDYVPPFDAAPGKEERERRQTSIDLNVPLNYDLDMWDSLPTGPIGVPLPADCTSVNDPKIPISTENSTLLDPLFASGSPTPMTASADVFHGLVSPRASDLAMIDLNLPPSSGSNQSSEANNHGVDSPHNLFSTTVEEQYRTTDHAQREYMLKLPSDMNGLDMLYFAANYCFPTSMSSRQNVSGMDPNSFSSSAPFFGGLTVPVNTNSHSSTGDYSDSSNSLRVGSANQYQGNGSFIAGMSSASTPQQQVISDTPRLSREGMQGDDSTSATAMEVSKTDRPWFN